MRYGRHGDEYQARIGTPTDQERKIVDLVAEGLTNRQIATRDVAASTKALRPLAFPRHPG